VRHTNFAANLRQEGAYSEGGAYMLVYTVLECSKKSDMRLLRECTVGQVSELNSVSILYEA
jgi:hypothetical protein